jgi:hypothetical protein
MISPDVLDTVLGTFIRYDISVLDFISAILTKKDHAVKNDLLADIQKILTILYEHPESGTSLQEWCCNSMATIYTDQLFILIEHEKAAPVTAKKIKEEDIQNFSVKAIASKMEILAPDLWVLLDNLHSVNLTNNWRKRKAKNQQHDIDGDITMGEHNDAVDESSHEYWDRLGVPDP